MSQQETSGRLRSRLAVPARPRSRAWVWYFVALLAMGAAAVTLPIVYNLSIQLRPEQATAARERWKANGPRDYDLQYQEKITESGVQTESNWFVEVRDGQVKAVTRDGQPLPASDYPNLTVDGQLTVIEKGLQLDLAESQRRNYSTADFDPRDGHPTHYVRRVRGSGDRLEWNINLFKPGEGEGR
jgi:hypothetical protein